MRDHLHLPWVPATAGTSLCVQYLVMPVSLQVWATHLSATWPRDFPTDECWLGPSTAAWDLCSWEALSGWEDWSSGPALEAKFGSQTRCISGLPVGCHPDCQQQPLQSMVLCAFHSSSPQNKLLLPNFFSDLIFRKNKTRIPSTVTSTASQ